MKYDAHESAKTLLDGVKRIPTRESDRKGHRGRASRKDGLAVERELL